MKTMNERLEEARKAAGFETPEAAASSLGLPYPTYIAHENGNGGFRINSAVAYARKFRVTLDWLLTGKGDGPSGKKDPAWEIYLEASQMTARELELLRGQVDFIKETSRRSDDQTPPLDGDRP